MTVRFFNTYEPVTDFYRHIVPELVARSVATTIYISRCEYREGRGRIEDVFAGMPVRVRRMPAIGDVANSRFRKAAASILYIASAALASLFDRPVGLNVFLTQPPLFGFWGMVLKRLRGQAYVCVLMDIYPDCITAARDGQRLPIVTRLMHWLSRRTWRSADGVVCIGRCMRDLVIAGGVDPEKVLMIPNWSDEKRIQPVEPALNPFRTSNQWVDDFIVLYSGNMGTAHDFDGLLSAARDLADVRDIRFVFIGDGARRRLIEAFARQYELSNLHMLPPQPAGDLANSQSLGDVHFVCLKRAFTGLMVPSKAYSALAAGRPLLYGGSPQGEIARLVEEERVGTVVDAGDGSAIRDAILEFHRDRDALSAAGRRAREVAIEKYSATRSIEEYVTIIQRLLESEPVEVT